MSKFYAIVETQVDTLLRNLMTSWQPGSAPDVDWGYWGAIVQPGTIRVIIGVLASLLYLTVFSMAGVYLWNHGLQPMVPGILAPLGGIAYPQSVNPYTQLFMFFFAYILFF